MTFLLRENSRQLGQPVQLYYFRWGSHALSYHAFTDSTTPIVAPGAIGGTDVTYLPTEGIERSGIAATGTLDRTQVDVTVARDNPLVSQFTAYPPAQVVSCVIRQAHLGETDSYPPIWVGRVMSLKFEGSHAKFALNPIATSQRRPGLRRNYQHGCPHVLYGPHCRADKEAATVTVVVSSVNDQTLVLPAGWFGAIPLNKYLGGLAQWTSSVDNNVEVRTILQKAGSNNVVLGGLVRGLAGGQEVELSLGCNHLMDDCHELHVESGVPGSTSNIHNFGGQPWIPLENPVGKSQRISAKLAKGG